MMKVNYFNKKDGFCLILVVLVAVSEGVGLRTSIAPPFRASTLSQPELRVQITEISEPTQGQISVSIPSQGTNLLSAKFMAAPNIATSFALQLSKVAHPGLANISIQVSIGSTWKFSESFEYHILNSGVNSTGLLDGAFIEFIHNQESSAPRFNPQLRKFAPDDWRNQMKYMAQTGIKTVVIQSIFDGSYLYVVLNNQTCNEYQGTAFFPSKIYPKRYPNFTDSRDKLEAMLAGADEFGINVYLGIGLFAWFDYRQESLCWHMKVLKEVTELYGHHKSIVGWYLSGEGSGCFWDYYPPWYYSDAPNDEAAFMKEFRSYVRQLDPLKFVILSPNSQNVQNYKQQWTNILRNVDIVMPFGFGRDESYWHTLPVFEEIAKETGTRIWVDLEIFQVPIAPDGYHPKPVKTIINEINTLFPSVENIVGYEFTGLLDSPEDPWHLGGDEAIQEFKDMKAFYEAHL